MPFLLFTTPSCPNCPQAKLLIKEKLPKEIIQQVDASSNEGLKKAQEYQISQVPTLIEIDELNNIIQEHRGIGAIYKL